MVSRTIETYFVVSRFFADVMVLNDIIEQAAGRQSRTPEQEGNVLSVRISFAKKYLEEFFFSFFCKIYFPFTPRRKCVYPIYRAISIPRRSMYVIWFKILPLHTILPCVGIYFAEHTLDNPPRAPCT